ncbi:MAG: D-tyrosyl-tRNA(Tyr) deacylase [Acidobacteria bacterium 13_1_40CM_2_68_5]|nr:MAG: D-tyrosyl-tRNA(Tyr) deacylase [Acidobacteria bacterium 13_1_40CM_2_68_5]OLE67285.1 MAG: D-tyrosyl-tRNA(Tyr) deacylase [Acidobacteria bacterium 13_1_20CM_2_68_7]
MKAVVQRVSRAEVRVGGATVGRIGRGLLVLIAIEKGDTPADLDWFSDKVLNMRVFDDNTGKMNRSALETGAEVLVVSQFTLAGDLSRGRRPGFERAAPPEEAELVYRAFVEKLQQSALTIATGRFRELMEVELVNDGPVTLILEGRSR